MDQNVNYYGSIEDLVGMSNIRAVLENKNVIDQCRTEIMNDIKQLKSALETTKGAWQGDDAELFSQKLETAINTIEQYANWVLDVENTLDAQVAEIEQLQAERARQASGLQ